ncbi:sensor histidine kinase [Kitasatospora sp. MBT63]|uniref:sensor histidine kinase n=1 Tax=Kitasatospora sp. MBT63 TaxID=1444768 RepID=UPI00053B4CEC|nr:histidine kinase [Kitasatospora sp. MBT63]
MDHEIWTGWPATDAHGGDRPTRPRQALGLVGRLVLLAATLTSTFADDRFTGWAAVVAAGWIVSAVVLFALFFRAARGRRIRGALLAAAALLVIAALAKEGGADVLAGVLWCGLGITALIRLPRAAGLPTALAALGSYAALGDEPLLAGLATAGGLGLLGWLLRLDAEARGTQRRLLQQERAARVAEAESAALAERARIAREIHDVLAHSLSAQLVHLEAARLMLDGGAEREQVRERVVAARRMAQEGLAETRQALSALRGELTPVGEFLAELAGREQAVLSVEGTPRPLAAEAGLAVRRTAQEALTNVRKHAPGGRVWIRVAYLADVVELEVRNSRPPRGAPAGALAASGSGYGLLGMRERAELLGGELQAGEVDGGWRVLLRVPA